MRGSPHLLGGEPPPVRFVYWLLIAIYTFAALAQGALTGDELVCAAAAVPALVLSAPVLGAQLASAVTDAAAGLLPSQSNHTTGVWLAGAPCLLLRLERRLPGLGAVCCL